ncbi:MAG: hypothetical protein ACJ8CR_29285 [Roseiflexaceae bacterium]
MPATSTVGLPSMNQSSSAGPGVLPLTALQKARLLVDCLPVIFFVLALVFTLTLLDNITGAPPPVALALFLGFVILWMGYQALQRIRDLILGVALVQEDVLERSWASRGRGRHFFGRFAQLGTLSMIPKVHFQSQNGRRYRVIYSPASKIVWGLEQLD